MAAGLGANNAADVGAVIAVLPFILLVAIWAMMGRQVLRDRAKIRLTDFEIRMRRIARAARRNEAIVGAALLPAIKRVSKAFAEWNAAAPTAAAVSRALRAIWRCPT